MTTRLMLMTVAALGLLACGEGQPGDGNVLRFGLQLQYAETDGFAPIARGQRLELGVQAPTKPALLNDYEFLDATLSIADPDANAVAVEKTSKGKFETTFARTGAHVLTATLPDGASDTLTVEVAEQSALRLATRARSVRTTPASGSPCTEPLANGAALPQLMKNQLLTAAIVPVAAGDQPLLGLLDLEFSGPVTVARAPGVIANLYTFAPTTAGLVTVHVTDKTTGQAADLTFDVAIDDATCPAQ